MKPAYLRVSPVNINGSESFRLMIVLKTKGCEYARNNGGGCTVCGFLNHASQDMDESAVLEQLDHTLETTRLTGVEEIDLLTLGSFLNDNEVSQDTRWKLLKKISQLKGIRRVSFESRAEYVILEKLLESRRILGDTILEFGIGLESSDDYIRNKVIKKGLSEKMFKKVAAIVKEAGCNLLTYLLIKPPGISEKKAIEDAISSAAYVFETASQYGLTARVAFEPVFVCENTPLEDLYLNSKYRLVNLWSVVEVIKKVHHYGNIFVGLSDENLSYDRKPSSCSKCSAAIIDEIERFNRTQDVSRLEKLHCQCKEQYQYELEKGII